MAGGTSVVAPGRSSSTARVPYSYEYCTDVLLGRRLAAVLVPVLGPVLGHRPLASAAATSAAEYDPEVDFECPSRDMYVIVPVYARGCLRCKRPYRV